MDRTDAARGALLGLACGDALGRPVEGRGPGEIAAEHGTVTGMEGEGVFGAPPGTTTDDTALARRLADSVLARGGFDPADYADRLVEWYETDAFGIGGMTRRSLERVAGGTPWHEAGPAVWRASPEGRNAGNGSVMRCAPLALAYPEPNEAASLDAASIAQSVVTHADPRCTYGCVVVNRVVAGHLRGEDRPLSAALDAVAGEAPAELLDALRSVPRVPTRERFGLTPYVVDTLELALHHALTASSTADAVIGAVNEGGDADTAAAVAGAVAGARHGASTIPEEWLSALDCTEELRAAADALVDGDFAAVDGASLPPLDVRDGAGTPDRAGAGTATGDGADGEDGRGTDDAGGGAGNAESGTGNGAGTGEGGSESGEEGAADPAEGATAGSSDGAADDPTATCPSCGAALDGVEAPSFCPACGSDLPD